MKYLTQILIVFIITSCHVRSDKEESNTVAFQNTIILPAKNLEIQKNKNVIYCASFEISWNKIRDEILNDPILLDKYVAWVDYLNKQPKNNSISPDYISAIAGFGKDDILSKIQSELKEKFNFDYHPDFKLNKTDILSVAYLKKETKFDCKLNEDFGDDRLLFNGNVDVEFFGRYGTDDPAYKSKLRIHDYINNDDFIFEIETESNEDEVYFAKVIPESTMEETYQKVIARINMNNLELLGHDDQVKIPYIKSSIRKEFIEVAGAKILNEGFGDYFIARAIQMIDFDLNESGITVESIAETYSTLSFHSEVPKKLIFDKPFLIILKEKEKEEPYFLMWIDNSELMNIKNGSIKN